VPQHRPVRRDGSALRRRPWSTPAVAAARPPASWAWPQHVDPQAGPGRKRHERGRQFTVAHPGCASCRLMCSGTPDEDPPAHRRRDRRAVRLQHRPATSPGARPPPRPPRTPCRPPDRRRSTSPPTSASLVSGRLIACRWPTACTCRRDRLLAPNNARDPHPWERRLQRCRCQQRRRTSIPPRPPARSVPAPPPQRHGQHRRQPQALRVDVHASGVTLGGAANVSPGAVVCMQRPTTTPASHRQRRRRPAA
jgi:hypothetical protein